MAKEKVKKKNDGSQDGFMVAEGLDGLRLNPTMYLGSLGADMAYRCVKEPVDNSYDEHTAGRNSCIEVFLDYDSDTILVADKAKGIPTDYKQLKGGKKVTIMTAAFTMVHAGGKFNDKAYKTSAGTHGVGMAAVNAVSEQMRAWSNYRKKLVFQSYSKGEITTKGPDPIQVKSVDKDVAGMLRDKPSDYGTIVAIRLDQTVVSENARRGKDLPKNFVKAEPDAKQVADWLRNMAYLNPGLEIRFGFSRKGKRKEFTFKNKNDLAWVPKQMCEKRELSAMGKPLVFKNDNISCAVVWADHPDTDNFLTFVNTSPTVDGGWHVTGFMTALGAAIKEYAPKPKGKGKGKKKDAGYSNSDLLIGLTGMFDWRMHGAQYTSQVKDKLASKVDREVHDLMLPVFEEYFKKNSKVAKAIIKRAQVMNKGREELASVVKSLADVKKNAKVGGLPAALAASEKAKPHERELFLVEGDSAGGSAKDARDAEYQEVLKAGGKPLNALRHSLAKVMAHEEIQNLFISLGVDFKTLDPKAENPQFKTDNLRTAHLIILVDPDPDGPLHPDTPVLTLDGKNPTIGELAKQWDEKQEPFKVYARDSRGNLVIADAIAPRVTVHKKKALRITFSDGTVRECTYKHKWKLADGDMIPARELRVGDGLDSVYFTKGKLRAENNKEYLFIQGEQGTKHVDKRKMPVHQFVMSNVNRKMFKSYRTINKGSVGGFLHIHHKDDDSLNNLPTNLEYITRKEHARHHMRESALEYNGSEKHLQDLDNFFDSKRGRKFLSESTERLVSYNKSQANRDSTARLNQRDDVKYLQMLGKCSKAYLAIHNKVGRVSREHWNNVISHLGSGLPSFDKLKENFTKRELMHYATNVRRGKLPKITNAMLNQSLVREYPTQKIQKFLNVLAVSKAEHGVISKETYNLTRKDRGVRGDPKWETGMAFTGSKTVKELKAFIKEWKQTNHTIVKIERVTYDKPQPYYCLTVPEHGNFMVADDHGNGICSSNCHIAVLFLAAIYRLMPDLFREGRVWCVKSPLFAALDKGVVYGGMTFDECRKKAPKHIKDKDIVRIKGWGEVSAEWLEPIAFNPKTRELIRINPFENADQAKFFRGIVAEDAVYRRQLLGLEN